MKLAYPIEVSGFTPAGRMFSEQTQTINISAAGCKFILRTEVKPGDVIAIRLQRRGNDPGKAEKPQLSRVVWTAAESEGWTVGAEMLQPENIWPMDFPSKKGPTSKKSS